VEIVPLSEELHGRAMRLYRERPDNEWGLTDCVSFVVMQERGLTEALTTDVTSGRRASARSSWKRKLLRHNILWGKPLG
jgi:hypothetical protein